MQTIPNNGDTTKEIETDNNANISNTQLYATVITLIATQAGKIPATQGRLTQGAFLDLMRAIDPALSAMLHEKNQRHPYTTSPVQGLPPVRGRAHHIKAGKQLWLRVTILRADVFGGLTTYFLSPEATLAHSPTLRLGDVTFAVRELLTTPGSHPWAGYETFNGLYQRWQGCPLDRGCYKIALEFASPFFFSRSSNKDGMGKFVELLPIPEMVFGSLAAKWNDFMPMPLDKQAVRDYARETVVVNNYNVRSQINHFWANPQPGTVGRVTYELKDQRNEQMARALNLLADFAFYSGLGAKTGMGMGMTRRY